MLLRYVSPRLQFQLTGIKTNRSFEDIYHLKNNTSSDIIPPDMFIPTDMPTFDNWYSNGNFKESHELYEITNRKFPWCNLYADKSIQPLQGSLIHPESPKALTSPESEIRNLPRLIEKNGGTIFKIIFEKNRDIFDNFSLDMFGYFIFDSATKKLRIFDVNGLELIAKRLKNFLTKFKCKNTTEYFKSDQWTIAQVPDIQKMKVKLTYYVFLEIAYSSGMLSCSNKIAAGINFESPLDDFASEKFRILSNKTHDALKKSRYY